MPVLELESPFREIWRKAYLRVSKKDGRKRVDLVNSDQDRTTISYARYLLSVKIGRFLTEDEEADHIDHDKTNDSIDNLQVLKKAEHLQKTIKEKSPRKVSKLVCTCCGKNFERYSNRLGKQVNKFCSRSCNMKYNLHTINAAKPDKRLSTNDEQEAVIMLLNGDRCVDVANKFKVPPRDISYLKRKYRDIFKED